jgi:hypothetical protein
MNKAHLALIIMLTILILIYIYIIFINIYENLNNTIVHSNDIPVNDISYDNEYDLLVPDKQNIYNPNDSNRPANNLSHQTSDTDLELKVDNQTLLINTTGDTPIVYSLDELEVTSGSMYTPTHTPSLLSPSIKPIDSGSGKVNTDVIARNNKLNRLKSIE